MNVEDDERIVAVEIVGERVEEENPDEPDAPDSAAADSDDSNPPPESSND